MASNLPKEAGETSPHRSVKINNTALYYALPALTLTCYLDLLTPYGLARPHITREWHRFLKPVQVMGMGTGG